MPSASCNGEQLRLCVAVATLKTHLEIGNAKLLDALETRNFYAFFTMLHTCSTLRHTKTCDGSNNVTCNMSA